MYKLLVLLCFLASVVAISALSREDYLAKRNDILEREKGKMLGAKLVLSEEEQRANQILMRAKNDEIERGFRNLSYFNPAYHFFDKKKAIEESAVFKIIKKMPKGAILHIHEGAIIRSDWVVKNVTYRDNIYICYTEKGISMNFFNSTPVSTVDCKWSLIRDERHKYHSVDEFDSMIAQHLTLEVEHPRQKYPDINTVWQYFENIFDTLAPILTFRPVWEDYFYESMKQCREDGAMYVEIRSSLPPLYELDGTIHDSLSVAKIYKRVNDRFVLDYPDSFGFRLIYSPSRFVSNQELGNFTENAVLIKRHMGDFVAGFDLVGQEDTGTPLRVFAKELLTLPSGVSEYYHAGETNWYGTPSDYNLIDAVLLGSKRLGHAYGILKHPVVGNYVMRKNIAIEVNPLSSQILMLVEDMRNHPASVMMALNYPVVISSDDPGLWGALPASHDMYEAFVGLASKDADLKLLKKLVINSIKFSAMPANERSRAMARFYVEWDRFIKELI